MLTKREFASAPPGSVLRWLCDVTPGRADTTNTSDGDARKGFALGRDGDSFSQWIFKKFAFFFRQRQMLGSGAFRESGRVTGNIIHVYI